MWKDKEIGENFILDFAIDDREIVYIIACFFHFHNGTFLILLGFLSFGLKLFNLIILPHDKFKVVIWLRRLKRKEKQIRKGW